MTQKRIAIIGCGAQAKYASEIFHLLPNHAVTHVLSPQNITELDWLSHYSGTHIIGYDKVADLIANNDIDGAIVCIANKQEKAEIFAKYVLGKTETVSAIHPKAVIASTATLGAGVIINAGAVIQPLATIGRGAMIHANVIVEHDCSIGAWTNLAPGCQLAGWVQIGEAATVFTGASVVPTVKIGKRAIVGAGAAVIQDVEDDTVVVGVPARQIKKWGKHGLTR